LRGGGKKENSKRGTGTQIEGVRIANQRHVKGDENCRRWQPDSEREEKDHQSRRNRRYRGQLAQMFFLLGFSRSPP